MDNVVIAYEPVWAIGTGETVTPDQAREAHAFVRSVLKDLYGETVAVAMRLQYDGSVTSRNAVELPAQPRIDGALVGGACPRRDDFSAIVEAARQFSSHAHPDLRVGEDRGADVPATGATARSAGI